ncbi:PTS system mannitol-specific IIABC component [Buchnera aphidicola str. Bp (Baizongia pistaciae)]|uniref:PTS system mannitol-specific EIICBA component n=1 Tax=Buchnera aphidicola subsp. Baizongia pistaciae (strain Bp) TaxID=224915 RepID=PTM3C_BUCBP|nr:PTS mannitol transporter subunit IICBA [Buchnera aphidicola]Q89A36.1 RecName: Full=PTS system mannitol-specific EIICBA component; AltName: Full=EIICBA-Mtl; Short=EII-Mtl; Includes: RecName: Full=Mannitol permease IIC component; AltName: Full=PTS system mannitol-specific EIIC component; Includes: RecName: Full=Mannitol-specific phosphotransferase enzyme IIB component; AltName: Full=PTS system mannitol-specific EIIB component; Includes: RecName: Full=Mannitol-specific phosphotransferase enzyme II
MSVPMTVKVQNLGRFLSAMIMPNISVFIAWGIISGLFIKSGWCPNQTLEKVLSPISVYLFPILIANTGGYLINGKRGAIVGSIAVVGAIISTAIPMLLGAMIIGPIGGWITYYFDKISKYKVKSGFEMLVNNFSVGILGVLLLFISFLCIGPMIEKLSCFLGYVVNLMINNHLLPFIAILIEPAKIFFLNNVINHGVLFPLGIQEVVKFNKSIFFLIESNPGPGIGVLMAWFFFGCDNIKKSLKEAIVIQLFGGIHEIYFPYVLKNPRLILALILGSITGIFILIVLRGGLISAASPGSIISILAMTPKGLYVINLLAIIISFLVSFLVSCMLLKISNRNHYVKGSNTKIEKDNFLINSSFQKNRTCIKSSLDSHKCIRNIIFACDAGMGSSAVAAGILRNKIHDLNIFNITVSNAAIDSIPNFGVDLIITHYSLTDRARKRNSNAKHLSLNSFLDNAFYNELSKYLVENNLDNNSSILDFSVRNQNNFSSKKNVFSLTKENIFLGQIASSKEEVIRFIGRQLVNQGYVKEEYIEAMLEREKMMSTWLGESIALPHGTIQSKDFILNTGIIFCQFPNGILFGDDPEDIAHLVIGVAARNNEHIPVVSNITNILDNNDVIKSLSITKNIDDVLYLFSRKNI